MKKYRYVQFVDGPWNTRSKTGYLFIVGKNLFIFIKKCVILNLQKI